MLSGNAFKRFNLSRLKHEIYSAIYQPRNHPQEEKPPNGPERTICWCHIAPDPQAMNENQKKDNVIGVVNPAPMLLKQGLMQEYRGCGS